ncbi:GyrI-like domain-containing protein [Reichenbachiella sp.]|uniref:GyrI-like domain-containing protein n=1 Tax=Reichenbachiella sp. TaxID=2184521 RepID=UPI003BB00DA1
MQTPRIVESSAKILVGMSMEMTYMTNSLTGKLWGTFMPRRNEIVGAVSSDKYSLQKFETGFDWRLADENTCFVKWAAMEVKSKDEVPRGMEVLDLEGGLYAVFIHKGLSSEFPQTLQYILGEWMPTSGYEPDGSRPQYELLGEKYMNNHPDSEEEVWFPIKKQEG